MRGEFIRRTPKIEYIIHRGGRRIKAPAWHEPAKKKPKLTTTSL
ncbi:MAG: hypothetical protein PUJ16_03915 [Campylobacteraceae bacterium]|nr:hypothetical protein [Campylobacteraceae bacterium]